jgi:photosystem II stability/assembly factor-like uncharacterized protein
MRSAVVFLAIAVAYASAADWHILSDNLATVLTGIAFPTDDDGFVCGDSNGVGSLVLHTHNAGKNWTQEPHDFEIIYLSMAFGSKTHGIAAGLGFASKMAGSSYTSDGVSWEASSTAHHIGCSFQDCGALKDGETFFRYGGWSTAAGAESGVSISHDGGKTFEDHAWGTTWTSVRYGSFISKTTGFLSGGQWPQDPSYTEKEDMSKPRLVHRLSQRVHLVEDRVTMKRSLVKVDPVFTVTEDNDFKAAVQKTTDGGKTWSTIFNHTGTFYPNGIQFVSEQVGWFVVEGQEPTTNASVAYVMGTTDGGKTWNKQLSVDGGGLFGVAFYNEKRGWAYGAAFTSFGTFNGMFYQTENGGDTWTVQKLPYHYIYDISLVDAGHAYASAFMVDGNSGVLVYN